MSWVMGLAANSLRLAILMRSCMDNRSLINGIKCFGIISGGISLTEFGNDDIDIDNDVFCCAIFRCIYCTHCGYDY